MTLNKFISEGLSSRENSFFDSQEFLTQISSGTPPKRRKAIFDRVYGELVFPPVLGAIIDTPQVQRLRDLKQLGNAHYVYPGATNTRFEHSLGVAHLAMQFIRLIYINHDEAPGIGFAFPQEDAAKRQRDVWCLGIAGLCHDLGHGPLSHMFEEFIKLAQPYRGDNVWHHESASISMLRALWRDKADFLSEHGLTESDRRFVELLIRGLHPADAWPADVDRPAWKRFMTDIIANKRSGLDVDKLDYIQRDSTCCLGVAAFPSLMRLFHGACVMETDGGDTEICYQDKLSDTIEEVFQIRAKLHQVIYQHRVTKVMDQMTLDAFLAAQEHFVVPANGHRYRLDECVNNAEAYLQTGDWVLSAILHSDGEPLARARAILFSIQNRHIYATIGFYPSHKKDPRFSVAQLLQEVPEELRRQLHTWEQANGVAALVAITATVTMTASDMAEDVSPLSGIHFFNPRKLRSTQAEQCQSSQADAPSNRSAKKPHTVYTHTTASRMPLVFKQHEELCEAFRHLASSHKITGAVDRAATPARVRTQPSPSQSHQSTPISLSQRKREREFTPTERPTIYCNPNAMVSPVPQENAEETVLVPQASRADEL